MKLRYELNLEDLLAFQKFHNENSPAIRKAYAQIRLKGALVVGLLIAIILWRDYPVGAGVGAVVGAILFAVIILPIERMRSARLLTKMCTEGDMKGFVGQHQVEILDDGLHAKSAGSESKLDWSRLDRIESDGQYTFVYVSAVNALIFPRQKILEGNYDEFVAALKKKMPNPPS